MRTLPIIILFIGYSCCLIGQQTLQGTFTMLKSDTLYLKGYKGSEIYTIDSTATDTQGRFSLRFMPSDYGLGYITTTDDKVLYVVLSNENTTLQALHPGNPESIEVIAGKQNQLLHYYAKAYPQNANAQNALKYLENIYSTTTLHKEQHIALQFIKNEIKRLQLSERQWLASLDSNSFLAWYLPHRKLATLAVTLPQSDNTLVPATIEAFRKLDYNDPRWYKSDLYTDMIEKHFYLIQHSEGSMDTIYEKMKISIDAILSSLQRNDKKLNEMSMFMFNLFEKRSLFTASEYLSLKLLSQKQCSLDDKLVNNLESYRKMRVGNTVPNIQITHLVHAPGYTAQDVPKSLYDIPNKYKVVIFAASWCEMCMGEIPQIQKVYAKYKGKVDIEMLMVSLDGIKEGFDLLASYCPFISTCDLLQWEGKAVKDYYISGTPTIYLLNEKNEIMLKPVSVEHLDVYIEQVILPDTQN